MSPQHCVPSERRGGRESPTPNPFRHPTVSRGAPPRQLRHRASLQNVNNTMSFSTTLAQMTNRSARPKPARRMQLRVVRPRSAFLARLRETVSKPDRVGYRVPLLARLAVFAAGRSLLDKPAVAPHAARSRQSPHFGVAAWSPPESVKLSTAASHRPLAATVSKISEIDGSRDSSPRKCLGR
jgi:hypothetical protein